MNVTSQERALTFSSWRIHVATDSIQVSDLFSITNKIWFSVNIFRSPIHRNLDLNRWDGLWQQNNLDYLKRKRRKNVKNCSEEQRHEKQDKKEHSTHSDILWFLLSRELLDVEVEEVEEHSFDEVAWKMNVQEVVLHLAYSLGLFAGIIQRTYESGQWSVLIPIHHLLNYFHLILHYPQLLTQLQHKK